ncbi:hypothetical protein SAMN05444394_2923 [Algoriphagus halophilus]|uniref:Uncharacterized protein n=1 Tax=Algoriphagus halophilus TaxID=226505 RepID=A0A1N6G2P1_9BACT|nr:hypothetical protein SAMN05444394_2923 [Algoriphagus halophilus]
MVFFNNLFWFRKIYKNTNIKIEFFLNQLSKTYFVIFLILGLIPSITFEGMSLDYN